MDSNLTVELYVTKKSCKNLFKKLYNDWLKILNWKNMIFLSLMVFR